MNDNFEKNYKKMESLLKDLEDNKDDLDKSLEIYKEASKLYENLNKQIDDYKAKIKVIDSGYDE